jgi:ribonuclease-3
MAHPKGELIERCKQAGLGKPRFQTKSTGPAHEPTFICDVLVQGEVFGTGQGGNKRDAERRASEEALAYLDRDAAQDARTDTLPEKADARPPQAAQRSDSRRDPSSDEPFEGPWPIFPAVLASALRVANSRVDDRQVGPDAVAQVQALALQLYKGTLENLGEVVEIDEED